jgi:hypothetical protein
MQAAIFERKAAMATVMVEKYKKEKNMRQAHVQYKIELTDWKKSQGLISKAALAHPLPNADVARAAVQLKVAHEAARVMKQALDKETDPKKKKIDNMVYKIEAGNEKKMKQELKDADQRLKKEAVDEIEVAAVNAKLATELQSYKADKAAQDAILKSISGTQNHGQKKKLALKGLIASEKLAQDEIDLEEIYKYQEKLDNSLFQQASHLKQFSVGASVAKENKVAADAKAEWKRAKKFTTKYSQEIQRTESHYVSELGASSKDTMKKLIAKEKKTADKWNKVHTGGQGQAPYVLYAVCLVVVIGSAGLASKMFGGGGEEGRGQYQDIGMS